MATKKYNVRHVSITHYGGSHALCNSVSFNNEDIHYNNRPDGKIRRYVNVTNKSMKRLSRYLQRHGRIEKYHVLSDNSHTMFFWSKKKSTKEKAIKQ